MHTKAFKVAMVSQRTKNIPIQLIFQIDVTFCSISKPKVDHESMNVLGFHYSR